MKATTREARAASRSSTAKARSFTIPASPSSTRSRWRGTTRKGDRATRARSPRAWRSRPSEASSTYVFLLSERGSVIGVYRDTGADPEFVQLLPTALGAGGAVAIPDRGLLAVSNEADLVGKDGGVRSHVTIYEFAEEGTPTYPTITVRGWTTRVAPSAGAHCRGWRPIPRRPACSTQSTTAFTPCSRRSSPSTRPRRARPDRPAPRR